MVAITVGILTSELLATINYLGHPRTKSYKNPIELSSNRLEPSIRVGWFYERDNIVKPLL